MRWLCLLLVVACTKAHPDAPSANACNADADCVAVIGNPCNPCGHCPYELSQIMTKKQLDALMAADYCPAREFAKTPTIGPQCSPCENHEAAPRPAAACVAHACVAR